MPLDVGGGQRGEGGPLSDAADSLPTNPATARSQVDYSIGTKLDVDKVDELILSTDSQYETNQYEVIGEAGDFLTCFPVRQGERVGGVVTVSKAPDHQSSRFDGETIGNLTYDYLTTNRRIVTNSLTGEIQHEVISPPYRTGEIIYATKSITADDNGSLLVDLNAAGRCWVPYAPRQVIIKTIQDDYLECKPFENGAEDSSADTIYVARPFTLRRTPWDGQTVAGVSYSYTGSDARVASAAGEEDESQIIIPAYIADQSVIIIGYLQYPIQLSVQLPLATRYFDMNTDGRAWAVAPV